MATGVVGTASMLRARRRDVNVKPNRRLDRKSSRGMLYENEELRLRTININAEVERGQSDIKKLRRENEQLRREIWGLREEYDRLEGLLGLLHGAAGSLHGSPEFGRKEYDDTEDLGSRRNMVENEQNLQNITCIKFQRSKSCSKVEFDSLSMVDEEIDSNADEQDVSGRGKTELSKEGRIKNNLESIFPEVEYGNASNDAELGNATSDLESRRKEKSCPPSYEIPTMLEVHHNNVWSHSLYTMNATTNSYHALHRTQQPNEVFSEFDRVKNRQYLLTDSQTRKEKLDNDLAFENPSIENTKNLTSVSHNSNFIQVSYRNKESLRLSKQGGAIQTNGFHSQTNPSVSNDEDSFAGRGKSLFPEGGNLDELLSDVQENTGQQSSVGSLQYLQRTQNREFWNSNSDCTLRSRNHSEKPSTSEYSSGEAATYVAQRNAPEASPEISELKKNESNFCPEGTETYSVTHMDDTPVKSLEVQESCDQRPSESVDYLEHKDPLQRSPSGASLGLLPRGRKPLSPSTSELADAQLRWLSKSLQNISAHEDNRLFQKRGSFPPVNQRTHFQNYVPNLHESAPTGRCTHPNERADSAIQTKQDDGARNWSKEESVPEIQKPTTHPDVSPLKLNFQNSDISLTRNLDVPSNDNASKKDSCISDTSVQQPATDSERGLKKDDSQVPTVFSVNLPSSSGNIYRPGPVNSFLQKECEEMKDAILFSRRRSTSQDQREPEVAPPDGMYRCIKAVSKTNRKCSGYGSHFQSLHKMSVIVGDTQQGRSLFVDHSLSSSCWQDSLSKEHCVKQVSMCSNSQRKMGFCAKKNIRLRENGDGVAGALGVAAGRAAGPAAGAGPGTGPAAGPAGAGMGVAPTPRPSVATSLDSSFPRSTSVAWERANSIGSMASSVDGRLNITKAKLGAGPAAPEHKLREENVPWCGCWGNGCI